MLLLWRKTSLSTSLLCIGRRELLELEEEECEVALFVFPFGYFLPGKLTRYSLTEETRVKFT